MFLVFVSLKVILVDNILNNIIFTILTAMMGMVWEREREKQLPEN